jgi:NDP-hexose 4-ketoreductase
MSTPLHRQPQPRFLILGSDGFIGNALFDHLDNAGALVTGADLNAIPTSKTVALDLLDSNAVLCALRNLMPAMIFHAAGKTIGDEAELNAAHVDTTRVLLESVLAVCPKSRVVIIGSAAEYGNLDFLTAISEDTRARPVSAYGRSKLRQSELAREYAASSGLDVVRFRVFNTLGLGQSPHLVAAALIARLRETLMGGGMTFDVFDPDSQRDFLDKRDVARLIWLASNRIDCEAGRIPVHIASGIGTPISDLASLIIEVSRTTQRLRLNLIPSSIRTSIIGDNRTLLRIVNPEPVMRISIRDSLEDMWHWTMT